MNDKFLTRIYNNVKKYLYYGYPSWEDIESESDEYDNFEYKNLKFLYNLNSEKFKENLLIQIFNEEDIKIEDSINKIFENFKIKVLYYIVNNMNVVNYDLQQILLEMRCKNLLNNAELFLLNMLDSNYLTRFEYVFYYLKDDVKQILSKIDNLKKHIKQKFI